MIKLYVALFVFSLISTIIMLDNSGIVPVKTMSSIWSVVLGIIAIIVGAWIFLISRLRSRGY